MDVNVLKNLTYGVYVVSSICSGKSAGCIANSLMQITYDTIAVSINHHNFTNKCIEDSKRFAVSILGIDCDENVIPIFGFQSGETVDKFSEVPSIKIDGLDVVKNSIGYLICELVNKMETDTHTVFLGKIINSEMLHNQIPMTYAYYHTVKNGTSPKNAPTYIEPVTDAKLAYKCRICGFIYEGDITKEPDTYVCPICKKGKEFFDKI